ncbi:hypothetical protein Pla175_21860 [Pirellulimonas nuda]|uniref:Uncharacterized protein n=1 Tax=Pirellulimonas nuda TaxID=2528009 RepID=A0A518DBF4_9BACT|nr:hypothetical protein [Pirellulimonas nuda]QDU88802.1 hypothetical protein Pla175_21860 [Pirellulimonas nuda]
MAAPIGCGERPDLAPVSGHVTLNGKPLDFGVVLFSPSKGIPAQGEIKEGGAFTMASLHPGDGALVGNHEVSVLCFKGHDPKAQADKQVGEVSLGPSLIPIKYTRSGMSGLTVEVPADGIEDFKIELSSKGPGR